jgi:hypothetical protein
MILKHIFTYKKKAEVENNTINTTKWDILGDKYSLQSKRFMILKFCKINQGITIYPKSCKSHHHLHTQLYQEISGVGCHGLSR